MHNITCKMLNTFKHFFFLFIFLFTIQIKAQFSFSPDPKNATISEIAIKTLNSSTCNGEMQTILKDDFGSGTSDRGPRPYSTDFYTNYNFAASGNVGAN